MEGDGPPLAFASTFPTDRDGLLLRVVTEVDISHTELDRLGDTETHAELEMDQNLLESGLAGRHECEVVLVGQPVDVGTVVVPEVDLHVFDHVVVEVLEIPIEDVEVPVPG